MWCATYSRKWEAARPVCSRWWVAWVRWVALASVPGVGLPHPVNAADCETLPSLLVSPYLRTTYNTPAAAAWRAGRLARTVCTGSPEGCGVIQRTRKKTELVRGTVASSSVPGLYRLLLVYSPPTRTHVHEAGGRKSHACRPHLLPAVCAVVRFDSIDCLEETNPMEEKREKTCCDERAAVLLCTTLYYLLRLYRPRAGARAWAL